MTAERIPQEQELTPESRLESLIEQYKPQLEDNILQQLVDSIQGGWDELSQAQKSGIVTRAEEFFRALHDYHDSYTGLKAAARKERMFHMDISKFQEGVKAADARERLLHSEFMSAANILSRTMKKADLDISWRGDASIYHRGGDNDSGDDQARNKFREWMWRIYHETFNS